MSDVAEYMAGQAQSAQTGLVGAGEDDPEQAARALELEDASGVPATAIYGDIDGFEQQHKAAMGSAIIGQNSYIADYLNSHPLAPKLSHDDLGQLDIASQKIAALPDVGPSTARRALTAFKEGFGEFSGKAILSDPMLSRPQDIDFALRHPAAASVATGIADLGIAPLTLLSKGFSGALSVVNEFGGRELASMFEYGLMRGDINAPGSGTHADLGQVSHAISVAAPWLRAGKDVPHGIDPTLNKIAIDQAGAAKDALGDALAESLKSATRDRNADFYENFVRGHVGDQEIGIASDAIRELYGDKTPTPDDNILGWIPAITDKLAAAEATGGDIRVPLADYLARVDPDIHDALEDHIRYTPEGLTVDEGKNLEPKEAPTEHALPTDEPLSEGVEPLKRTEGSIITEPLPLLRGASGLEPMFSIGDRKLKLERRPPRNANAPPGKYADDAIRSDEFKLLDENGQNVGWLEVVPYDNGKRIYVDNVGGMESKGFSSNSFGPALTRDLLRQLKTEYPNATHIGGYRISGAREKAATEREVWIKFDKELDHATYTDLQSILSPRRSFPAGHGVQLEYAVELAPHQMEADRIIREELARITPKQVTVNTPNAITIPDKPGMVRRGMYSQFYDQLPAIAVALDGAKDTLGVARHEAIHHLRQQGFFSEPEWQTLTRAARDQDWIGKYGIEHRYAGLPMADKLEESIAEGYRNWKAGQPMPPETHAIFQRIKEFFDSIREKLSALLGREATWEDLFKQVDSGEIGSREGNEPTRPGVFRESGMDIPKEFQLENIPKRPANLNEKMEIPDSLTREERDWENYGKHLAPEEVLNSEVVWGAGDRALEEGKTRASGFARYANMLWQRMGANKYISEELAGRYIRSEEGKAKGIDIVSKGMDESSEPEVPFTPRTIPNMGKYLNLIKRRNAEDLASAGKRALEEQRKTQTKEWKANRVDMRDEVREEIESRPDIALDQMMAGEKVKFHPDALTEAQREALPREYLQKKGGLDPNDLAGYFGFHSGDALVERLGLITSDRKAAGLSARDWFNHTIDTETDRRMEERYGNLNQSILEDAKEQAISETQLDILHEEVLGLGLKAGSEFPISKEQLKAWNKEVFDKTPIGTISTDEYLRTAGKAGRAAEAALLKEDYSEAFREKQRQNNAMILANFAKAYEKSRKQFDRTAKTMRKREVPSVSQEWTNWVHDLLLRTGNRVDRSVQDLAENIERQGEKTLQAFAEAKEAETFGLRETPIADFLLDGGFRKPMKELTAEEFAGLKQSVDVLVKQGRDEKKIYAQGEAADRDVVLREMRGKLGTFPAKPLPDERGVVSKALDRPRMFLAGMTNIETIMNRWDRADPRGIFNRYITYPLAKASNYKSTLEREYAKAYGALGEIKDGGKFVDAPFADPLSRTEADPEGRAWPGFTRKHVLAMLQNAGSKSNWKVLARGYSTDPEALMGWLHRNTTKEDWDRAQKMGDTVFKSLVDKADLVYEHLTGATIQKIPLEPIETPYGTYPGWYHPLIADPIRKEVWVKDEDTGSWKRNATGRRGSVMDDSDYFHASTANGYTKRRTGAVYPLDLNFDVVPSRIKQMIHDIAFRDTIIQTEKIFGNKSFQAEVTKHYGAIYSDLLMPYLKAMAGAESIPSKAGAEAARVSEYLRQNVISTYIGFNPMTALKHGPTALVMSSREVGPVNFLNAVRSLYGQSSDLGLSNSEFAMKHSEELQRRERHWQDTIAGQHGEIEGASGLREKVIEKGSWLVAQSDMLSAKPTWIAQYNKSLADGLSHGESVDLADRAVRRAHGSTAGTNQPALVRGGGPLHGWLTSVYGFFGTAMQRRIEIAHKMNDAYQLGKEGELLAAAKRIPGITTDIMTYVIWPTLVEEAVTGINQEDHRGLGARAISAGTMGIASSVLYLRDLVHAFTTGQDPGVGLISSPLHDIANVVRDVKRGKEAFSKAHAGKTVGDTLTVFGEATGLAPKTIASATRFGIDLVNNQQHPKSGPEWFRGLTRGTAKIKQEK